MTEEGLQKKEYASFICGDKLPDSANELVAKFFNEMEHGTRVIGVSTIQVSRGPIAKFPPVDPPCTRWRVVRILFYAAQESAEHFTQIADYDKIKQELSEKIEMLVRSSIQ